MSRNIIIKDKLFRVGDLLIAKNLMRLYDLVEIKDILFNINTDEFVFYVNSLDFKDVYYIKYDDILGEVILKEGVDLYELFKRK